MTRTRVVGRYGVLRPEAGKTRYIAWIAVWLSAAAGFAACGPASSSDHERPAARATVESRQASPADARRSVGSVGQVEVGGVLRNTGSGWYVLNDAAHESSGLTTITQTATYIEVNHPVGALKVHELQVTPDEYYASVGIRVGASVGLTYTRIFFYQGTSATPVNPATLTASNGNLWLSGSFWV